MTVGLESAKLCEDCGFPGKKGLLLSAVHIPFGVVLVWYGYCCFVPVFGPHKACVFAAYARLWNVTVGFEGANACEDNIFQDQIECLLGAVTFCATLLLRHAAGAWSGMVFVAVCEYLDLTKPGFLRYRPASGMWFSAVRGPKCLMVVFLWI